jgi:protease-4
VKRHPFLLGFLVIGVVLAVFWGLALATWSLASSDRKASSFLSDGDSVGVIEINGLITESRETLDDLRDYAEDDGIKAIVLRIDSPGGSVGPTQEIYREVLRLRDTKPVVASLGGVAASGGYYIAAAAGRIFANEGTLTGSIGVIMDFVNIEGLLGWMRVRSRVIKSGKFKDIGSPTREMSRDEEALLQDLVNDVRDQFVEAIVAGRGKDRGPGYAAKVRALADGRIFSGRQAKALGLVDELGGLRDAIRAAGQLGGIKGEPDVVSPEKEKPRFFDLFFTEMFQSMQHAARGAARDSAASPGLRY